MEMGGDVTLGVALMAGFLSFVSPCVLPLVPAYLSFMTGVSVDEMRGGEDRWQVGMRAGLHSVFFVLGFSLVFILLGASASVLGRLMMAHMDILAKVGGGLIILFGLHFMGVFRIALLNMEARFNPEQKPPGVWGAFLIGLAFAFGWTPCVGPILAAILGLAGGQESINQGVLLLGVYSAGLGIPFIIAGLAINIFFVFFTRIRQHMRKVEIISGLLLVIVGILFVMGDFTILAGYLMQWFPSLAGIG